MAFQDFIYLSEEDFIKLSTNGTAIVNGVELTYDPIHTQYYTYDDTAEQIADLQAEQTVQSAKITAIEESVKKYYRHRISMSFEGETYTYTFEIIDSTSTAYTKQDIIRITGSQNYSIVCIAFNSYQPSGCYGVSNDEQYIYFGDGKFFDLSTEPSFYADNVTEL